MNLKKLKKKYSCLINTPLHPQWLLARNAKNNCLLISSYLQSDVLDIGCGHKAIKKHISDEVNYYGLDYYDTAEYWYESSPDIYGNANLLPIKNSSTSNVLLLDVLEHLPDPEACIKEVFRVLKTEGKLILQVPFMYPIHDDPLDFNRWTKHGLEKLLNNNGLSIIRLNAIGKPIETAGLILNIGLCKTLLNAINEKNILMFPLVIVPLLIPLINITSFLLSYLSTDDDFMPLSYFIIAIKKNIT